MTTMYLSEQGALGADQKQGDSNTAVFFIIQEVKKKTFQIFTILLYFNLTSV